MHTTKEISSRARQCRDDKHGRSITDIVFRLETAAQHDLGTEVTELHSHTTALNSASLRQPLPTWNLTATAGLSLKLRNLCG